MFKLTKVEMNIDARSSMKTEYVWRKSLNNCLFTFVSQLCINNLEVSIQQFVNNQNIVMTYNDLQMKLGSIRLASEPRTKTTSEAGLSIQKIAKTNDGIS